MSLGKQKKYKKCCLLKSKNKMENKTIEIKDNRLYIKKYAELENKQIEETLADFPNEELWMVEIFKLLKAFEKRDEKLGTEWRTCILLAEMSSKEIHLCFLSFLRRHFGQAHSCIRNAIEAAGFINAIRTDEEKAKIWMCKKINDEKSVFASLKKERWIGEKATLLKKKMHLSSEMCHANFFKTLHSTKSRLDLENKRIIDVFSFFDASDDKRRDRSLLNFFITICFEILDLYCDVFGEILEKNGFKDKLNEKHKAYSNYIKENAKDIISTQRLREKFKLQ